MDTPSPEMKRTTLFNKVVTPKSAARKAIANSPAFLVGNTRTLTDISELSMSPLQLFDSPVASVMTPSTSGESPRKKTSTPTFRHNTMQMDDKDSNSANTFTSIKAKRRLIEEESDAENQLKKRKMMPKLTLKSQRRFGQINHGVSHKIRKPKQNVSLPLLTLSDIKKAKQMPKQHPFAPLAKPETPILLNPPQPDLSQSLPIFPSSPASATRPSEDKKVPKKEEITPHRVITKNWNQRYKKYTKERKFFKSREGGDLPADRVVTVSVMDNLKLKITEKAAKSPRKSPRKTPRKTVEEPLLNKSEADVDILQQDWDDVTDTMDISSSIQDILDGLSEDTSEMPEKAEKENVCQSQPNQQQQFFPLFYKNNFPQSTTQMPTATKTTSIKNQWIRARNDGENQMMLDAGQKAYGVVQCPECMLVYHLKEPEDELLHNKIHNTLKDTLKFTGWKKERVVRRFDPETYITVVHPGDAAHCWKKVHTVLKTVVDHELGFSEIGIRNPDKTKVYLYIADKAIVGVLVVEALSQAFHMLPSSASKCCSTVPTNAVCGVSRIWTLASFRRRKVASRLLDAMRSEFVYGKIIALDEVAFSDPTENGLAFAQNYTKRPDFLVYNM